MNGKSKRIVLGGCLVVLGAIGGRALATGVPTVSPLTYSGVVTDEAGKPYAKAVPVTVALFDGEKAVTAACAAAPVMALAGSGYFEVVLPGACVDAVHGSGDLWVELVVGEGKVVLPRSRVGAVPFALEAGVASAAGGELKVALEGVIKQVGDMPKGKSSFKPLKVPLGKSAAIETEAGTIVFNASNLLTCKGDCYTDYPAVTLYIDGIPAVGAVTVAHIKQYASGGAEYVETYMSWLQVSVPITKGKHVIELESEKAKQVVACKSADGGMCSLSYFLVP